MATTKIPSPASIRRAITTLKKGTELLTSDVDSDPVAAFLTFSVPKHLLSPKRKRSLKHKKVENVNKD